MEGNMNAQDVDPDIDDPLEGLITINPEVGKCYEYQYPGEMRETNEWEYAGIFIQRTEFISYNGDTKFFNDHFDNQNYIKDTRPELRTTGITDNITKAKDSNFRVKQAWRPLMIHSGRYATYNTPFDVFYREVKCRNEYNLLKNKKNLALAKLLLMQSDYSDNTRYEEGITNNIFKNLEKIYKPDDRDGFEISQGNIYEKMEREERERDKLIKSRQRLATMRAMHSREGPFRSIRYEPNIMENIGRYLSIMRQAHAQPSHTGTVSTPADDRRRRALQGDLLAEAYQDRDLRLDLQYGSGKSSRKRSKRSKRSKHSKRNKKNYTRRRY